MIKVKEGKLRIKGGKGHLLAEFTVIAHGLYNEVLLPIMSEEEARETLMRSCEHGTFTVSELGARLVKELAERLGNMAHDEVNDQDAEGGDE